MYAKRRSSEQPEAQPDGSAIERNSAHVVGSDVQLERQTSLQKRPTPGASSPACTGYVIPSLPVQYPSVGAATPEVVEKQLGASDPAAPVTSRPTRTLTRIITGPSALDR